ncbi:MAG: type II toxin-antitoxin system RelE/ParE family toxin [Gammaproteobacteria bacterium]|nr:type II toxin-antitoxin system RelE/ParE family toxin [Gammaproteobacteria bacterium]
MDVLEYIREDGSSPYRKWFDSLNALAAAKVSVAKTRLELGNTSSIKWFAGIGEYRIDWGPGYRIYLIQDGEDLIVLLGGGTKKRQQKDIDEAKAIYKEYKVRKKR